MNNLSSLKIGQKCIIKEIEKMTLENMKDNKPKIKRNPTESCISELKQVMDKYKHLDNHQIQYIDRWLLSNYIKPEEKVYY